MMKFSVKTQKLKLLVLGAGGLGLSLRALLYLTGTDEKGLLVPNHFCAIVLCLLSVAVLVGLFLLTRSLTGPAEYAEAFPSSGPGALGALAMAIGAAASSVTGFTGADTLMLLRSLFGIAAAGSMVYITYCRITGRKPLFLFHGILCVFFALDLI